MIRTGIQCLATVLVVCVLPLRGQATEHPDPPIAVVSVQSLLEQLPERADVEQKLSKRLTALQAKVDEKWREVADLSGELEDEQEVLSKEAQAERQATLIRKETELSQYWNDQSESIKAETEIFSERLAQIVEDAVGAFAREHGYLLIFEKANGKLIYAAEEFDRTEDVLQSMLGKADPSSLATNEFREKAEAP